MMRHSYSASSEYGLRHVAASPGIGSRLCRGDWDHRLAALHERVCGPLLPSTPAVACPQLEKADATNSAARPQRHAGCGMLRRTRCARRSLYGQRHPVRDVGVNLVPPECQPGCAFNPDDGVPLQAYSVGGLQCSVTRREHSRAFSCPILLIEHGPSHGAVSTESPGASMPNAVIPTVSPSVDPIRSQTPQVGRPHIPRRSRYRNRSATRRMRNVAVSA